MTASTVRSEEAGCADPVGQTPPATHVPHPLSVGPRGMIPKQWTGGLQREGLKLSVPHEGGALGLKAVVKEVHTGREEVPIQTGPPPPRAGSLYSGTVDIWGWILLWGGGCPGHCRMFSSIPAV